MSNRQDSYYFENLTACGEISRRTALKLRDHLANFKAGKASAVMEEIHKMKRAADEKRLQMVEKLAKAFITPMDKEDILVLSSRINEVTDSVEKVFLRMYMNDIQIIRPEAVSMLKIAIRCCEEMCELLKELADFKHSRKWRERILHINALAEEENRLLLDSMRALHCNTVDVFHTIAWREIYDHIMRCTDACKEVADEVERVFIKNL